MLHLIKKKRKLRPSKLILLIVLLSSNTFAWFIYATKIDSNVTVHVRAWNVIFEAGDHQVTDVINLNVDSVYPGMENYNYEIKAYNHSEVTATLSYQILQARILNQEYISVEKKQADGLTVLDTDLTSEEIRQMLLNDYPFSISISTSNSIIQNTDGVETYSLQVTWPYESNNDELDTLWGIRAYQYKESNPTSSSIALEVKIVITQNAS